MIETVTMEQDSIVQQLSFCCGPLSFTGLIPFFLFLSSSFFLLLIISAFFCDGYL